MIDDAGREHRNNALYLGQFTIENSNDAAAVGAAATGTLGAGVFHDSSTGLSGAACGSGPPQSEEF